jgi:hypothetical protein
VTGIAWHGVASVRFVSFWQSHADGKEETTHEHCIKQSCAIENQRSGQFVLADTRLQEQVYALSMLVNENI